MTVPYRKASVRATLMAPDLVALGSVRGVRALPDLDRPSEIELEIGGAAETFDRIRALVLGERRLECALRRHAVSAPERFSACDHR